jgi:peptidoglycan/LPS O-acetylase OafA/YrhL
LFPLSKSLSGLGQSGVERRAPRNRFYALDALRGLAALLVVLSHWRHFFYTGLTPSSLGDQIFPLYRLLHPFYSEGHRAVDFFFCLSGFIFFLLYSKAIAAGHVRAGEFSRLRFSRLYPLHLLTLLLVAVGQGLMRHFQGSDFVYPNNDPFHFLLQLACVPAWGNFELRNTFNGPFWSVSAEIFLYGLFYLLCRLRGCRALDLFAFIGAGFVLEYTPCLDLGRGMIAFFSGGITYLL